MFIIRKNVENLEFLGISWNFFLPLKIRNFHGILSVLGEIFGILLLNFNSVSFWDTVSLIIFSWECKMSTINNKYGIHIRVHFRVSCEFFKKSQDNTKRYTGENISLILYCSELSLYYFISLRLYYKKKNGYTEIPIFY